jgi:hypothetical protein
MARSETPIVVSEEAPHVKILRRSRSRFSWGDVRGWLGVGARVSLAGLVGDCDSGGRGGQGRPVRAARRGSLDGAGVSVVASHDRVRTAPWRSLVAVLWLDTADLHHCAHAELGDRYARRPAISSRWFAWCVPATARRAHSARRPRHLGGGHGDSRARVLAVSEPAQAACRYRQRISPSRSP